VLIPLSDIKPSPFNPKKPLTKKRYEALKLCVNKFGFKRSLCICKDFTAGGGGDGFICLDGNTAIQLLTELEYSEVKCEIVENVTDEESLMQFMAGYSIRKEPLYSAFAEELGKVDFEAFTGLSADKYTFDVKIDAGGTVDAGDYIAQSQYFLTLPPDCVEKLKAFTKSRVFKNDNTKALLSKIDAMGETEFLEKLLRVIL
jgi:hypothetical protein